MLQVLLSLFNASSEYVHPSPTTAISISSGSRGYKAYYQQMSGAQDAIFIRSIFYFLQLLAISVEGCLTAFPIIKKQVLQRNESVKLKRQQVPSVPLKRKWTK